MIQNIIKKDNCFEGNIELEEWEKFWNEKLFLKLNIGGDSAVDNINQSHENGYKYFLSDQIDILEKILDEIYLNYAKWQKEYDYKEEEKILFMPDIKDKNELKLLIKPKKIYIMNIEKEDIAYIGIEFICTWDEEFGLGVMTHKSSIISIGGADNAFMSWIAEEDLKS